MYAEIWWNVNERNGKMAPVRAGLAITLPHFSYQVSHSKKEASVRHLICIVIVWTSSSADPRE